MVALTFCVILAAMAERQFDFSWVPVVGRQIQALSAWHACEVKYRQEIALLKMVVSSEQMIKEQLPSSAGASWQDAWQWASSLSASLVAIAGGSRLALRS